MPEYTPLPAEDASDDEDHYQINGGKHGWQQKDLDGDLQRRIIFDGLVAVIYSNWRHSNSSRGGLDFYCKLLRDKQK
jgi:hypothetical protein